jgi:hypothetical protein
VKGGSEVKKALAVAVAFTALVSVVKPVFALSVALDHPEIFFPKQYDQRKAEQALQVLRSKKLIFRGGLISYWPPDWSTTLVYGGNTKALNAFLTELSGVPGLRVKVSFSRDLDKESGSALRSGSWWVKYSHVTPDVLTVRINLAAAEIVPDQLEMWSAPVGKDGK